MPCCTFGTLLFSPTESTTCAMMSSISFSRDRAESTLAWTSMCIRLMKAACWCRFVTSAVSRSISGSEGLTEGARRLRMRGEGQDGGGGSMAAQWSPIARAAGRIGPLGQKLTR